MKYTRLLAAAAIACLALVSCKSEYELLLNGSDTELKYSKAFEYFNQGKYQKAAQLFESLSMVTAGTPQDDTVQYYWGLSNYRFRDYITAQTNFQNFITNYPASPFTENATYLKVDCLYNSTLRYELDQTPTNMALAAIGEYLTEYPATPHLDICQTMIDDLSERLDKKAFESARLYYKMEDYLASRVAFRNILKDDADNIYREDILYYTAMSSFKYAANSIPSKQQERYLTFVDDYLNFIGELPESDHRRELDILYKRAQKALGKYSGSEEELDKLQKEFEKEQKQMEKKK